jgi:hypothetical protein
MGSHARGKTRSNSCDTEISPLFLGSAVDDARVYLKSQATVDQVPQ